MYTMFQIVIDGIQDITTDPDQTVDVGQRALELVTTIVNNPYDTINAYGVKLHTEFLRSTNRFLLEI